MQRAVCCRWLVEVGRGLRHLVSDFALVRACVLIASMLGAGSATAAAVKVTPSEGQDSIMSLIGDIEPGDAARMRDALEQAQKSGRPVRLLRLSSNGGQFQASLEVADVIRGHRLTTVVPANHRCASGCVTLLAAGLEKIVESGALVGVHAAAENGRETEASRKVTQIQAQVFRVLSVPDAVIEKMIATPHNQIAWLCPSELRAMGAQLRPPVVAPPGCSFRRIEGQ